MESFQKSILLALILTASLPGLGFCYSITKGPENATVLAGSEARFNCTVSAGWKVLIWLFQGSPVLTVLSSQGSVETTERFTSRNYTSGDEFTSELIIHNTQLNDSGRIECSIQQPSENNFAFLSVQVNGSLLIKNSTLTVKDNQTIEIVCEALGWAPAPDITWMTNDSLIDKSSYVTQQSPGSHGLHNALSTLTLTPRDTEVLTCLADIEALPSPQNATVTLIFDNSAAENYYSEDNRSTWVIVLAIVLSFLGIVLLVVIIVVAVRCCLKRRESTYQTEIRKVSAEKKKEGDLENRQRSGNENLGYIPEELWNTEQSPGIASLPPMISRFAGPDDNLHISSVPKVRPQRRTDYLINPKKIRNVTLV
ncbi:immunoglobulin superfamily member 5 isoform X1 [Vidua macroura]|uniref:immunoglobulin superfamily member 5 isoform X1 n=1 Tax=Vidua macroura TaxID=187451 RepID=UPI0023A82A63|nr:immunoglobulin superfamily member 5 isoform X1 [Vidua macroura]XP_053826305.1 immunoglobulin superfamily member 5 isoform X1 [Vidua macroura]